MALVLVIMVMMIVVVIAAGFTAFTTSDLRTADSQIDATTSYFLAEAGLQYGLNMIQRNLSIYPSSTRDGQNAGSVVNMIDNSSGGYTGEEHVVISDVSYTSSENWLSGYRYAGTFVVYQKVTDPGSASTDGRYQVELVSTGYIKRIPSGTDRDSTDASCSRHGTGSASCTYRDTSSTTDDESDLTKWFVRAKRTVQQTLYLDAIVTGSGAANSSEIRVDKFYEKFR